MSMRVLVTGAAGFIGSNFVRHWAGEHPADHVVALDLLTYAGNRANLADVESRITFVQADICDTDVVAAVLQQESVDVVVNFAAESHNSLAVLDPARFFRTNVLGTQSLLEAARERGVVRFHHVSTCEVYGDLALDDPAAFTETSPYNPRTPYNASKAGADHAVRAYHETYGLPITISNCSNNYGPYQFPEKVVPNFTTRARSTTSRCRCTRRRTTNASGSTSSITAGRSKRSCSTAATARRTTSGAGGRRRSTRSPTSCSTRSGSRPR